jgi:hypothetical protein
MSHLLPLSALQAVVISAQHELHHHKQLAAALHKATRSHSEAVIDIPEGRDYQGEHGGLQCTAMWGKRQRQHLVFEQHSVSGCCNSTD